MIPERILVGVVERRSARLHKLFFGALVAFFSVGAAGCSEDGGGPPADPNCPAAQAPLGADPAKGESFPDIELTTCGGETVTTSALRCQSKVTLIAIGAGWCLPCNEETPDLEKAYQELLDEDIGVVQVMVEDVMANPATTLFCQKWVDAFDLTMPVYIDPVGETLGTYDNAALPLNVIVDRSGKALHTVVGAKLGDVVATLRAEAGSP